MIRVRNFFGVVFVAAVFVVILNACADSGIDNSGSIPNNIPTNNSERSVKADYELDANRSLAIAIVKEKSEGPFTRGCVTLAKHGVSCQQLKSEVLYFYNESRLKELCKADGADCRYNNYSIFESHGYFVLDEEFYKNAKDANPPLIYDFYIDWDYRDTVNVGDIILIEVGTLLNQNPNKNSDETPQHHLVIQPFGVESKSPILAKFLDGKLQLSVELEEQLALYRLYDDPEPERIGIKDGDSIDDVIAFIECVEQDVVRFRNENQ